MSAPMGGLIGFALRPVGGMILFAIGAVVAFAFGTQLTQAIVAPVCQEIAAQGTSECALVYSAPAQALKVSALQAVLAGFVLALPSFIYVLLGWLAPTLAQTDPRALLPYIAASAILVLSGVIYAIFVEAPAVFAPAVMQLGEMSDASPLGGVLVNYARAAALMAASYAATLQIPLVLILMVKSWRLRRALKAEGRV